MANAIRFAPDGGVRLDTTDEPQLSSGEVLIRPRFVGINPTDAHHRRRTAAGSGEHLRTPGVEVSGAIAAVSPDVTRWSVGDRVFGIVYDGGLADTVVADAELLMPVPGTLDDLSAAATPEVFITAHDGLVQGGVSSGTRLLVTGASGSVGLAAVQLGRALGADVIGLSRQPAGRELLESLGVRAYDDHAARRADELPYRDAIDVVLELVGAQNARSDVAALDTLGRLIFIAVQGDEDVSFGLREFKTKRLTMIGSTLRRRGRAGKVAAVRRFETEALGFLASGAVAPRVAHVFPARDVEAAFAALAMPGRFGKVVLDFEA